MNNRRPILSAFALAALALLALEGCGLGAEAGSGSITFAFGPSARALGAGESYRVEVYYGADLYAAQESSAEGPLVFEALPTGRATVFVAQGSGSGATFAAAKSGSFDITIVPGDNAPAAVSLAAVPFAAAGGLAGADVSSVAALGTTVYAATGAGTLHYASFADGSFSAVDEGPEVPAGMTDLSLSVASYFTNGGFAPQVWVNGSWTPGSPFGSGGILPWVGNALDEEFASGLMVAPWVGAPAAFTVLRSGSYPVSNDGLAIFYQRNGGIGGVYVTRDERLNQDSWPWITNQIDLSAAMGELGEGQEPILDFATSGGAAYFVTAVTTLRISAGLLEQTGLNVQKALESEYLAFAGGIPSPIISVAVRPGASGAADLVYLGTVDGLWSGEAGEDDFFAAAPEEIPVTAGYRVKTVAVSTGGSHVAFVCGRQGSPDTLAVMRTDSPERAPDLYHALEGLPGAVLSSIRWLDDDTLLVAGSGGLAALEQMPE